MATSSLASYLTLFGQRRAEILALGKPFGYNETVRTTWLVSFEALAPHPLTLLRLLAFMAAETAPADFLLAEAAPLTRRRIVEHRYTDAAVTALHGEGHPVRDVGRTSWATTAQATLHCLTGCAIGEALGMVIGTGLGWPAWPTVALAVALAFVFGYALTMRGVLRAGVDFRTTLTVAPAASGVFRGSLAFAFAAAFVVTLPINRWLISRGRDHAVVHAHHH